MADESWHTHNDARFSEQLDELLAEFPEAIQAWNAVRWKLQRDPRTWMVHADTGVCATTTRALRGVPALVWFYIFVEDTHEVEILGVARSAPDDD